MNCYYHDRRSRLQSSPAVGTPFLPGWPRFDGALLEGLHLVRWYAREHAIDSPPTTLAAARLCLDQLATSAAEVVTSVNVLDADHEGQTQWWAHALTGQCRAALNELTFLAAWTSLPASSDRDRDRLREIPDIDEIPTLRQLANFEADKMDSKVLNMEQKGKSESPLLTPDKLLKLDLNHLDKPTFFATNVIADTVAFSSWKGSYHLDDVVDLVRREVGV